MAGSRTKTGGTQGRKGLKDRLVDLLRRGFHNMLRQAPMGQDGEAIIGARQIYILPTGAGLFYALVVLGMLLGSLNYQNNLGLLFAFFLVGVGLVAMHHSWFNLLGLRIKARAGDSVFAGQQARFEVILSNRRHSPRFDLHVSAGFDPVGPVVLESMSQHSAGVSLESHRRGWLRLQELMIETRYPMGLFRAWCYASCKTSVLVYPQPADQAPEPLSSGGESRGETAAGGEGADDFLGPRDYRPGDSPLHLDWKAFARDRGLVIKQFGGDEGVDLWVDWQRFEINDLERRISLLTRQVMDAGAGNLRFGLRIPGTEIGLDRGRAHIQRCLSALALYGHVKNDADPFRRAT